MPVLKEPVTLEEWRKRAVYWADKYNKSQKTIKRLREALKLVAASATQYEKDIKEE